MNEALIFENSVVTVEWKQMADLKYALSNKPPRENLRTYIFIKHPTNYLLLNTCYTINTFLYLDIFGKVRIKRLVKANEPNLRTSKIIILPTTTTTLKPTHYLLN